MCVRNNSPGRANICYTLRLVDSRKGKKKKLYADLRSLVLRISAHNVACSLFHKPSCLIPRRIRDGKYEEETRGERERKRHRASVSLSPRMVLLYLSLDFEARGFSEFLHRGSLLLCKCGAMAPRARALLTF